MKTTRLYNYKDVDMLLASRTIAENFVNSIEDLKILRTNWDETYVNDLLTRIDLAMDEYLGIDRKKKLKEATSILLKTMAVVIRDLGLLKAQILYDLPMEANRILKNLGYEKYWAAAQTGDQEALIEMLYIIEKEMSDKLKDKICEKGTNPVLIDNIVAYADQIKHLNTTQESLKKTSKELTEKVKDSFNEIYREVSGICKIARAFYHSEPVKKEQFAFTGIVKNMNLQ